jgi:hypothetical protein
MANKINTVAKGDAFEDRVFYKIKNMLELGELALNLIKVIFIKKKDIPIKMETI